MAFENGVKNIQAAAFNGARTVHCKNKKGATRYFLTYRSYTGLMFFSFQLKIDVNAPTALWTTDPIV